MVGRGTLLRRRSRREAATLVEILISLAVGLLVLAATLSLITGTQRMSSVGDLAGALQEGAIALQIIQRDLSRAVPTPDAGGPGAVVTGAGSLQTIRAEPQADGTIRGTALRYEKERTPGGNFRIRRRCGSENDLLPGMFRTFSFVPLRGAGGIMMRVTLTVSVRDSTTPVAGIPDAAVLSTLVRVPGPELIVSTIYSQDLLKPLGSVDPRPGPAAP